MASAPVQLDQNLINQLKLIVLSDTDFDHLTDDQKKTLASAAILAGLKTNLELFLLIKTHPEVIGLPPLPAEKVDQAQVNAQVIAANLELYLADREQLEKRIASQFKDRSQAERDLILRMFIVRMASIQASLAANQTSTDTARQIAEIYHEIDTKIPPLEVIEPVVTEIIDVSIPQTGVTFTPDQRHEAIATLTTAAVAGITDLADPKALNEVIQIALASNPDYQTPTANLYHQVVANTTITPIPHFDAPGTTAPVQVTTNVAFTLTDISFPPAEIKPENTTITLSAPLHDRAEQTQKAAANFSASILTNSRTDGVMATINGNITDTQRTQLFAALIADNLVTRVAPTQEGATAARIVRSLNRTNPFVDPVIIEAVAMGMVMANVQKHIVDHPDSKVAQFFHHPENANVIPQALTGSERLANLDRFNLGARISERLQQTAARIGKLPPDVPQPKAPGPLSGLRAGYQSATQTVSGFLPGRAGQIFNVITHPFQSIQSYLGNFIGNRIVGQFKNWLAEKVVAKIANETIKKGAELILKQGVKQGVKLLAEQGLKVGLQAVAQAANIAPGAGLLLAAAIEVAFYVGGKTLGYAMQAINGVFRSFTGEDFDARAALAAPLVVVGGVLGFLGSATAVAASTGVIVLIASTFLGFVLYISVIGIAPIISAIAQLESGQGTPYSVVSGGVVPEGCPSGWPTNSGIITQGPRTTLSHANTEAIDIGVGLGTPIMATHNGLAISNQGSGGPYGNFVDINGTCNGIAFTTRYGHMVNTAFNGEKIVKKGDIIGYVDSTGNSTGNHLHYEIRGGNLGDINQFLPKHVPVGCETVASCGSVSLP